MLIMEVSTTNDDLVNPIVQRILELREKSNRIKSIEASQRRGNRINKKEHKLLHSKALVNARLDELVKLRQRLCTTLIEDLGLARTISENSESTNSKTLSENSESDNSETLSESDEILCDTYFAPKKAKDTHLVQCNFVDGILTLLCFAYDSFQMMLQRLRYLPFNCLADEAMDQLTEKDLDLILVSVSRLEDSTIEEEALEEDAMQFYHHAKLRVKQQDPYYPNALDPYSMRERLEKIISKLGDYYSRQMEKLKRPIKLNEEQENSFDLVNSLERKIDETEKKYEESSRISEERMNQIIETESRMIELKTNMQRLEEKLSDMEAEKYFIRSQTLSVSSSMKKSPLGAVPPLENGHHQAPAKTLSVRRSHVERNPESVEALFKCVTKDLGFSEGKPVAAFTLYNCLLHWKLFELEKTSIFNHLITLIGNAIEDQDNIISMAYWLSNISALFFHLQRCLRVPARKPPTPTGFFGRMAQSYRSSSSLSSSAFDVVQQVDAKYPALLFKQQLAAFVEKIYGILRENMKNDLSPLLSSCIKEHQTGNDNSETTRSWLNIIECLNRYFKILKENYVPPILIQKVFNQTFQYINAEIFNSLIMQKECCTFNNGEYVKSGLAELELWCTEVTEEYIGSSLDELNQSKQAVKFLVAQEKDELSYDDLTNDICPVLSSQQLYRICTLYSDENDNTKSVSSDVTSRLKLLMTDDSGDDEKSYMLEDNSSVPINVEEIPHLSKDKTVLKVKPPAELLENVAFQFLHDYSS